MMDDPDRLASELNAVTPARVETGPHVLVAWLEQLASVGGSDLLLVAGAPPSRRVKGAVERMSEDPLDGAQIEELVYPIVPAHAQQQFRTCGIADCSLRISNVGRFRVNLHHERGRCAASIRLLPRQIPPLKSLGLPEQVERLVQLRHGLVLIGGATGSGKTTTLAALVQGLNQSERRHIITIEDPIEYEHTHQRSIIEQIEIGVDAPDFATSLRAVVRQAPDVIVIGEMRDPDTMRIALAAAEMGHLVLSTVHTTDVVSTVGRIADSFPPERQPTIRQELAMALSAVMTQTLLPRRLGGLVPAAELLMVGYGARQHIRRNALQHLHQEITITRKQGSFTREESLAALVAQNIVDEHEAMARAQHADELLNLIATARQNVR
jgi:twitching motility protein PilT